jgi:hypothetical protein
MQARSARVPLMQARSARVPLMQARSARSAAQPRVVRVARGRPRAGSR